MMSYRTDRVDPPPARSITPQIDVDEPHQKRVAAVGHADQLAFERPRSRTRAPDAI
jgi:hypothetical protein